MVVDKTRKYLSLECTVCKTTYLQQERLFRRAIWKNRCRKHRHNEPTCGDCGAEVWNGTKRCRPCSANARTLPRPNCIDCGLSLKELDSQRCLSCHNKKQDRGLSTLRNKFNQSYGWRSVRTACFTRDNYTCQHCGQSGGINLNAHHIQHFAVAPDLRLNLDNLITLCVPCHRKEHSRAA